MENLIAEPIRVFIHEDLRQFKVLRGLVDLLHSGLSDKARIPAAPSNIPRSSMITFKLDTPRNRNPKNRPP